MLRKSKEDKKTAKNSREKSRSFREKYGKKSDSSYRLIFDAFLLFLFNRNKFFSRINEYIGTEFGDRGKNLAILLALGGLAGGILFGAGLLILALIVALIDCLIDQLAISIAITLVLSLILAVVVLFMAFTRIKEIVKPFSALDYGKRRNDDS